MDLKSELLAFFVRDVLPLLLTAVLGLLSMVLVALRARLQAQTKQTLQSTVGTKLEHLASVSLHALEARVHPALVKAGADGIITKEEFHALLEEAKNSLLEILGTQGKAELQSVLGMARTELEAYLRGVLSGLLAKAGLKVEAPVEVQVGFAAPGPVVP